MSGEQLDLTTAAARTDPGEISTEGIRRPDGYRRRQEELADQTPDPPDGHLTKQYPGEDNGNAHPVRTDREWYCTDCRRRVTRSLKKDVEYGHASDCPHSVGVGGSR